MTESDRLGGALQRRGVLLGAAALAGLQGRTATAQTAAPAWPVRQARFLIPFAAGGAQDILIRLIAQRLSQKLGSTFIVENKAGAGGAIGTMEVARAAPDGATLLATTMGISILPGIQPRLGFDPVRELAPVSLLSDMALGFMVRADSPIRDLGDLLAKAKAEPDRYTYGSGGVGTAAHLAGAMLNAMAGVELTHVPYGGVARAVTAIYTGEIDTVFGSALEILPHIRAGRGRLLAITLSERLPNLPDVPTMAEYVPGYTAPSWFALFAPKGFPAPLMDRLVTELAEMRTEPSVLAWIAQGEALMRLDGPAPLAERLATDIAKWRDVIARANIRAE
ncbi:Bug family tripartite tricarboxylate transporter substrate binding protein [Humitalea sp. 24SJ18S-53]|uniref:Bug family tripartite tricarboxylate transporter substrate binding protein n=1 Tax=Humitalea sp. 24SJ18S-53 TaxID=3422307 RepID=UPI003D6744BF